MPNPRLCYALTTLRNQVDKKFPNRSDASDGWIGDTAHQARLSQHNPNEAGVVCAIDITHDPANGVDCHRLMEELDASNDDRIFYLIHDREIDNSDDTRTPYYGTNPHVKHLHISVQYASPRLYDDGREWILPMLLDDPASVWRTILMGQPTELYTRGAQVTVDQRALIEHGFLVGDKGADGYAGPETIRAIRVVQISAGLPADGAMGDKTRAALKATPPWTKFTIRAAQVRLNAYGFRLVVDGVAGPKTEAAIKAFQQRVHLEQTGKVGPVTWTALHNR